MIYVLGKGDKMFTIRLAEHRDLEFLQESYKLLDNAMNKLMSQLMGTAEDDGTENPDDYWMGLIEQKSGYILVAMEDNEPAGMAVVHKVDELEAHLEDLVVWPDFRRHGIGQALVKEAKNFAIQKGYRYMSLNVLPNNENAIRIYENEGFKERKISMLCRL